jgi:hypothetical protein
MKLSHILPLVVGSAAAGILASTSPAHALTYNWTINWTGGGTYTGTFNGSGTLNETSGTVTSLTGDINGSNITALDINNISGWGNTDQQYPVTNQGIGFVTANGNQYSLIDISGTKYLTEYSTANGNLWAEVGFDIPSGTPVPFDIPGGATIPSVGALLALGAMRKARKSLASKTRLANPVCTSVS